MGTTSQKTTKSAEPLIRIGIFQQQQTIRFSLTSGYKFNGEAVKEGEYTADLSNGQIRFRGDSYNELFFETNDHPNSSFLLHDVIIGLQFHWERKEDQRFKGSLQLILQNTGMTAINIILLEDYLFSVISSEMRATSSEELLKAHAVISRSWLLAQVDNDKKQDKKKENQKLMVETSTERIKWHDREDHDLFDVCADDHCQRYQGITRQSSPSASRAIKETRGEILLYDNTICDTRFSKCCGGITEAFNSVWEPVNHPYLRSIVDSIGQYPPPDLTLEVNAERWIRSSPPAFCNTHDADVLKQILNEYDQETADFYRWKVSYTQEDISNIIKEKSGIDFGNIIDLQPIKRGPSGRIILLNIIGDKRQMTIGKELEIRRTLSPSHLYSSAFVVDRGIGSDGMPEQFILTGAGWGHGVGLCQIGAAIMAAKGHNYKKILSHYYPDSNIVQYYP